MSNIDVDAMPTSRSANKHFNDIVDSVRARRGFIKSGLGLGAVGFLGAGLSGCGDDNDVATAEASPEDTELFIGT